MDWKVSLKSKYFKYIFLIFSLGLFLILSISSIKNESLIIDELAHIPSGFVMTKYQDFSLNLEHPPLFKVISSIPLLFMDIEYENAEDFEQWQLGNDFLFERYENKAKDIIFYSRLSMIIFHSILFVALFFLLCKVLGNLKGILAFSFILFCPNIIAHSRYVTNDVSLSILGLIFLIYLYIFIKNKNYINSIILGFILGLLILTKFSALIYIPLLFISFFSINLKREKLIKIFKYIFLCIFISFFLIYVFYFVLNLNTNKNDLNFYINFATQNTNIQKESTILNLFKNKYTRPFGSFFIGFVHTYNRGLKLEDSTMPQCINNNCKFQSEGGFWYYFPLAFLYKSTTFILIFNFLCICFFFFGLYKKKIKIKNLLFLYALFFCILYFLISIISTLNIGIRHFLPFMIVLPLLFLSILDYNRYYYLKTFIIILCFLHILVSIKNYPYYLSYFNEFIPQNEKHNYLIDSNLDWGEKLERLYIWAKTNNIKKIYVDYWGKTPLNFYDKDENLFHKWNVRYGYPEYGYFALASHWITHSKWRKEMGYETDDYSYVHQFEMIESFDGGLFIYYIHK